MDLVLGHHTFQVRQPAAVPELSNNQPDQPSKQSHAEDHTEQIKAASGEDHRGRTGRFQSRKEHHRVDLQLKNPLRKTSSAPARPLPCLHRLQEGLRQGFAFSFVGNHEEVQHQCQHYRVIKHLFDKTTSAVFFNGSIGDWFRTTRESDRDVYSHSPSLTHFQKRSRQTPQTITKALSALEAERSPISALLMTSMA